jgi:hypothetical protein
LENAVVKTTFGGSKTRALQESRPSPRGKSPSQDKSKEKNNPDDIHNFGNSQHINCPLGQAYVLRLIDAGIYIKSLFNY